MSGQTVIQGKHQAIYAALGRVQNYLKEHPIPKGGKVAIGNSGYSFRGIDQIYQTFSPVLETEKIVTCPLPPNGGEKELVSINMEGKTTHTVIQGTLRFLSLEDGSYVDTAYLGQSKSTQGKDLQAARSFAYRDALIQFFCVPFEGTEEPEEIEAIATTPAPEDEDKETLEQFRAGVASEGTDEGRDRVFAQYNSMAQSAGNKDLQDKINDTYKDLYAALGKTPKIKIEDIK
jgi:hypothetical protein